MQEGGDNAASTRSAAADPRPWQVMAVSLAVEQFQFDVDCLTTCSVSGPRESSTPRCSCSRSGRTIALRRCDPRALELRAHHGELDRERLLTRTRRRTCGTSARSSRTARASSRRSTSPSGTTRTSPSSRAGSRRTTCARRPTSSRTTAAERRSSSSSPAARTAARAASARRARSRACAGTTPTGCAAARRRRARTGCSARAA